MSVQLLSAKIPSKKLHYKTTLDYHDLLDDSVNSVTVYSPAENIREATRQGFSTVV